MRQAPGRGVSGYAQNERRAHVNQECSALLCRQRAIRKQQQAKAARTGATVRSSPVWGSVTLVADDDVLGVTFTAVVPEPVDELEPERGFEPVLELEEFDFPESSSPVEGVGVGSGSGSGSESGSGSGTASTCVARNTRLPASPQAVDSA